MRMRYRQVTYRHIDGSSKQLEQRYRQLLNDALHQSQQSVLHRSTTWRPLADICESADGLIVKVELAGMKEEEIDVTLYENALVISGERRDEHDATHKNLCYYEAQIRYGPFRVEVFIPSPVERDSVTARYENGFLWVTLPRVLPGKPEGVRIQRSGIKE
ncbi:MAG: Hsp20/alpha crystallin family protein [Ktedonobacteraceae bacterium]|nr:Hsp20/alpha crystallin family protein [Ktedonobacteraceae bacterium]MBV9614765.1 Hsp20/alpha crystallin family protein [Ktedonobacteraceae bacterium]MBV9713596.1 Hsp20/alpha crystallin family protein [Ktedonobacteraceae bacterium]